jgi:hypothetical protein
VPEKQARDRQREYANIELAIGELAHPFGEELAPAVDGFEAFRKAGGQAPADRGRRLRDGRRGEGAAGGEGKPGCEDVPAFDEGILFSRRRRRRKPSEFPTSH